MTALQTIAVDGVAPQPWRNGGGRTRELATWPGGGTPWQLRLSVADIDADGPFSAFDGVDRWFAVLQGAGVRLALPDGPQMLTPRSPPLLFAGEAAPGCWLTGGATRDFNLMLRRGSGQAGLLDAAAGQPWTDAAPLRGLITTTALQLQIGGAPARWLPAWTLVLAEHAGGQRWCIADAEPGGRALWLSFTPHSAPPP